MDKLQEVTVENDGELYATGFWFGEHMFDLWIYTGLTLAEFANGLRKLADTVQEHADMEEAATCLKH